MNCLLFSGACPEAAGQKQMICIKTAETAAVAKPSPQTAPSLSAEEC